jgi:hypothetical protein
MVGAGDRRSDGRLPCRPLGAVHQAYQLAVHSCRLLAVAQLERSSGRGDLRTRPDVFFPKDVRCDNPDQKVLQCHIIHICIDS